MPVASRVRASLTARLLPRASITTTLAPGLICWWHNAFFRRLPNASMQRKKQSAKPDAVS